jgi:protein required for attachment to host cells
LETCQKQGRFDRLVICAAPQMLGEIRNAISPKLKQSVYAEIDKDLIHIKLSDLPKHLQDVIAL